MKDYLQIVGRINGIRGNEEPSDTGNILDPGPRKELCKLSDSGSHK